MSSETLSRIESRHADVSGAEAVVDVQQISKLYHVYATPQDRLRQFVFPRLQRLTGRTEGRYFREFHALHDVSFTVARGQTFGIVGKNGSGKSTLLQIICGTLAPTSGSVRTVGRLAALLELGAGFNPEFTGRENVYLNGTVLGLSKEQIDQRFDQIASFADIGDFIDQPVKTYSSGMYVRLAFGVIANVDADILVIDEALAVGDAYFVQKCMRFLTSFMEQGTLLFVSHDTGAVQRLCSQAVLLDKGQVQMIASPKRVAQRYLARLYSEHQDTDGHGTTTATQAADDAPTSAGGPGQPAPDQASANQPQGQASHAASRPADSNGWGRDMRQEWINQTPYRSDIEIFRFQPSGEGFGTGLARVTDVRLTDTTGKAVQWAIGGEPIRLQIEVHADIAMDSPIVGFEFKDRLGQTIFGDNTHLATLETRQPVVPGQFIRASFSFHMPAMQPGDYSVSVAIADGSQDSHVQHAWMHDALIVRVHNESICFGLVGVPMQEIALDIVN